MKTWLIKVYCPYGDEIYVAYDETDPIENGHISNEDLNGIYEDLWDNYGYILTDHTDADPGEDEEAYERIVRNQLAGGKFKLPKEYRHYDSFEDIEDSESYAYLDPTISNKLKNALANYTGTEQMGGRNDFLYTIHDLGVQIPLFVLKDCQYDEIRAIALESIKKGNYIPVGSSSLF
jgi:hypothetical protein